MNRRTLTARDMYFVMGVEDEWELPGPAEKRITAKRGGDSHRRKNKEMDGRR